MKVSTHYRNQNISTHSLTKALSMKREKWEDFNKYANSSDEETLWNKIAKSFIHLNYWYDCLNLPFSLLAMKTKETVTFICF